MSYGKTFVAQRRIVQQEFQPAVVTRLHRPVIVREVTALLSRLLATPDVGGPAMVDHFRQYVSQRFAYIYTHTRPFRPQLDRRDHYDDDVWPPGDVGQGPLHPDRRNSPRACGVASWLCARGPLSSSFVLRLSVLVHALTFAFSSEVSSNVVPGRVISQAGGYRARIVSTHAFGTIPGCEGAHGTMFSTKQTYLSSYMCLTGYGRCCVMPGYAPPGSRRPSLARDWTY